MTELDAWEMSVLDMKRTEEKIREAAGPEEARRHVFNVFIHRVSGLGDGAATDAALKEMRQEWPRDSLSLQIAGRMERVIRAANDALEPEDMRAIVLWVAGSPDKGGGFIHNLMKIIPDRDQARACERLEVLATQTRRATQLESDLLFKRDIRRLSRVERRFVITQLNLASLAWEGGDGERFRSTMIALREKMSRFMARPSPAAAFMSRHPRSPRNAPGRRRSDRGDRTTRA